jgi:hypothetical protein
VATVAVWQSVDLGLRAYWNDSETTRSEIKHWGRDLESALRAIEKSKTADEVFALLNGFIRGISNASASAEPSLGPTPVQSAEHIAVWLAKLKAVSSKGDQVRPDAGEALAKLYAVMRAASRKLEAIAESD